MLGEPMKKKTDDQMAKERVDYVAFKPLSKYAWGHHGWKLKDGTPIKTRSLKVREFGNVIYDVMVEVNRLKERCNRLEDKLAMPRW